MDKRYRLGSDFYLSVGGVRIDNVYRRVGAERLHAAVCAQHSADLTVDRARKAPHGSVLFAELLKRERILGTRLLPVFVAVFLICFYAHIAENADFEMRFQREFACIGRACAGRIHRAVRVYLSRQRVFRALRQFNRNGIGNRKRDCGKRSVLAEIRYNKRNRSVALDRIPGHELSLRDNPCDDRNNAPHLGIVIRK